MIVFFFAGIVLPTLGRKLFWLFVACTGFSAGFTYAQRLWMTKPELMIFIMLVLYSKLRFCEGYPRDKGDQRLSLMPISFPL